MRASATIHMCFTNNKNIRELPVNTLTAGSCGDSIAAANSLWSGSLHCHPRLRLKEAPWAGSQRFSMGSSHT